MTGSYDPELNLIYWGIGNPAADFYGDSRREPTCTLTAWSRWIRIPESSLGTSSRYHTMSGTGIRLTNASCSTFR